MGTLGPTVGDIAEWARTPGHRASSRRIIEAVQRSDKAGDHPTAVVGWADHNPERWWRSSTPAVRNQRPRPPVHLDPSCGRRREGHADDIREGTRNSASRLGSRPADDRDPERHAGGVRRGWIEKLHRTRTATRACSWARRSVRHGRRVGSQRDMSAVHMSGRHGIGGCARIYSSPADGRRLAAARRGSGWKRIVNYRRPLDKLRNVELH